MDEALSFRHQKLRLVAIGSSVLILDGMPERGTADIDIWKTSDSEGKWLTYLSDYCQIPLDPPYSENCPPHMSWVINDFIGLPEFHEWEKDSEIVWSGDFLTIIKPPVGVILGGKLAAWRAKDIRDIDWILDHHKNWKESLDYYYPLFDPHIKNQIDRNTFFFDLYLNARKSKIIDHPESEASLILPQKSKQPKTS